MLGVLVEVLDFDRIASRCGGARKRHVAFVAPFGIYDADALGLGSARLRRRPLGSVVK
jgi:hypothetical protein